MPRHLVALIRHGHYRQPDGVPSAFLPWPLTELGDQQARICAGTLATLVAEHGWTIDPTIDASPLLRAWQTARLIADGLTGPATATDTADGYEVVEAPALAERCLGSAANLTVSDIEEALRLDPRYESPPPGWKASAHYRLPYPGAESLREAGTRVARHLESRMAALMDRADGPNQGSVGTLKLVVGHGGAFRHAAALLGVLTDEQVPALSMFHATPVVLERTPAGIWQHVTGDWKVRKRSDSARD